MRNKAVKVKDTIKGSPTSLPLNPSLPLNSEISTHVWAYSEAEDRETLPQDTQPGTAGLEVFKASFLQKSLPRPQSRLLGLAEVFPA